MESTIIKKILFITNYPLDSNASAAIRNRAIIEGFVQCGYKVITLTREPSTEIKIKNVEQQYFKSTSLAYNVAHRIRANKDSLLWKLRISIAKIIGSLSIYDNQKILLKNLEDVNLTTTDFDIVMSSSDSKVSHAIAEQLIKMGKVKANCWVQYWGDPFYDDINKNLLIPGRIIKKEEKRLLEASDYIFYTSPFTLKSQKKLFPNSSKKMYYIPTPYIEKRIYEFNKNKKTIVGYYGSYHKKDRDIIPLYSAALEMHNIDFQFIGSSDIELDNKENILVKMQIPYNEILKYESKCDILICVANKSGSTQIPGKLYHYAATNKAILFIYEQEDKEIADFFKQFNRYYMCENKKDSIKETLEKIMNNPNLSALPIEKFHCKSVVSEVLEIIN